MKSRLSLRRGMWALSLVGSLTLVSTGVLAQSAEAASASGTLSIVAGNGTDGLPQAGQATATPIGGDNVAVDGKGDVFFSSGYYDANTGKTSYNVAKVSPQGVLSIVAGNGKSGKPKPGKAINSPVAAQAIAVDAKGNLYAATSYNTHSYIVKVTTQGTLSIIAGNGKNGIPKPGKATRSPLASTRALALDNKGNLFISASLGKGADHIVKITPKGTLVPVYSATGGNGLWPGVPDSPALLNPDSMTTDAKGNLYVAADVHVLKISARGVLSTVAGNGKTGKPKPGKATSSRIDALSGIAVDAKGNLYTGDGRTGQVLEVSAKGTLSIVAGNGKTGDLKPGKAKDTPLAPLGLAVDKKGNLFVSTRMGVYNDQNVYITYPYVVKIAA